MANTYTQIHIQLVFAVKYRQRIMVKAWRGELFMYITGIINNHGHKLLAINGVEDHVHILIGLRPVEALSTLVQEIKKDSSKWINDKRLVPGSFRWQDGFSAFSYSMDALPNVIRYIENQEEHHKKKSFKEEYVAMLKEFKIDFDDRYIFADML
ncbi:MAG: IS200/IS605 family transposase [Chryseolinea sp.]